MDLSKLSVTTILNLIHSGTTTSRKVVEHHFIEKIELVNPCLLLRVPILRRLRFSVLVGSKIDDTIN